MNRAKQTSVQSTEPKRSELLRPITVPTLIALIKNAQQRRPEDVQGVRPERLITQPLRSIIIGRRPDVRPLPPRKVHPYDMYRWIRDAPGQQREQKTSITTCVKRAIRREILFQTGIAGLRKTLSPGRGGTYKRTAQSLIKCITRRR